MDAAVISKDQLAAEFAKQRTTLRDDVSRLIQESTMPLQASLDSLQTTVNTFQQGLTSVESVSGDNFERVCAAESTIKMLQTQNQSLLTQLDDRENRSRRADLRILHIPEGSEDGKDPVKFMSELLMQVMGPDVFTAPPELERVPDLQIWTKKTPVHIPGLFLQIPAEGLSEVFPQQKLIPKT